LLTMNRKRRSHLIPVPLWTMHAFRGKADVASLRLYVGRLNYLGPLVDFVGDEFAEITGR
jgi:hypothetical protein